MGKKRGRNYTTSERALMLIGVGAGMSHDKIAELLSKEHAKAQIVESRELPQSSYDMLKNSYIPDIARCDVFTDTDEGKQMKLVFMRMLSHILSPKDLASLGMDE